MLPPTGDADFRRQAKAAFNQACKYEKLEVAEWLLQEIPFLGPHAGDDMLFVITWPHERCTMAFCDSCLRPGDICQS